MRFTRFTIFISSHNTRFISSHSIHIIKFKTQDLQAQNSQEAQPKIASISRTTQELTILHIAREGGPCTRSALCTTMDFGSCARAHSFLLLGRSAPERASLCASGLHASLQAVLPASVPPAFSLASRTRWP
jgi:hypothetical protein